jgi:uncharacterized membrane protein
MIDTGPRQDAGRSVGIVRLRTKGQGVTLRPDAKQKQLTISASIRALFLRCLQLWAAHLVGGIKVCLSVIQSWTDHFFMIPAQGNPVFASE